MKVTVGICTWNNSVRLEQTLAAVERLDTEGLDYAVLVVDNNSTDRTSEVLAEFEGRLPLRSLFEPQQGISYARNRIQEEAECDLLLWTDDDAIPATDWLRAYVDAAEKWPEAAFFGGPVGPSWEKPPPGWVLRGLDFLQGAMVIRDLGPEPMPLSAERLPFGVNMVFRREPMKEYRFPTNLGVTGGKRLSGEETVVFRQALADGLIGRWVPSARVDHHVSANRMTWRFVQQYYIGYGQSLARTRQEALPGKRLFGVPIWLWRQLLQKEAQLWWQLIFCPPEVWVRQLKRASQVRGEVKECLLQSGQARAED